MAEAQAAPRIVAGFGRSGTTWIQDVLAQSNDLRAVFEPLHPFHIEGAAPFAHRYLGAKDEWPELQALLDQYLNQKFWSLWADYRVTKNQLYLRAETIRSWKDIRQKMSLYALAVRNLRRYHPQRKHKSRIMKLVRGNMLLAWMHRSLQAKVVFVIRHPAAVVMSQMHASEMWNPYKRLDIYRSDERLLEVLDSRTRAVMSGELEMVEAFALSWCIENKIAIQQARENNIPIFCYETLLESGETEWRRLIAALDLPNMPEINLVTKPSQQAWGEKAANSRLVRKYDLWMDRIEPAVSSSIQKMLDVSEVDFYSVNKALPNIDVCGAQD
jgi:hypothetical protein